MARKTRRNSKKALFSRVYAPVHHLLAATRNVGRSIFSRSGRIVNEGLGAVDNIGSSVVKHANMAVNNVTRRKHRKNTRRNKDKK